MKIKDHKGNEHEIITIAELYLWAKEKGLENSGIGLSVYENYDSTNLDEEYFEYCEEINYNDIEIGRYYIEGNPIQDFSMLWLNNH